VKFVKEKNGSPHEFLERIQGRVPVYFHGLGKITNLYVTRSVHRTLSEIYYLLAEFEAGTKKRLVVKVCDTAEAQFVAMNAMWPHFAANENWKIPRPLDYLPESSALVMEEVSGRALMELLPRFMWGEKEVRIAETECTRIGQWLRFFHDIDRAAQPEPLNTEGRWPGLEETMCELRHAEFEKNLYPLLESFVVPLAPRAVRAPRPIANIHGDFTVDNVMLNQQSVIVVDVCSGFRNAIDLDIASFLNSLLSLRLTRFVPWSAIERMRERFLFGYFGTEQSQEMTMIFLQCVGLADVALDIVQRRRSRLVHWWVERTVSEALKKLTDGLRVFDTVRFAQGI
jgi:hypothetical protein